MASIITLTPLQPIVATIPITGTSPDTKQNLWEAVDISAYDLLDLQLIIYSVTFGTTGTNVTVGLTTGMQIQSDSGAGDGWVNGGSGTYNTGLDFTNIIVTTAATQLKSFGLFTAPSSAGLLKYLRWTVKAPSNGSTTGSITFAIRGIGRKIGGS